MSNSQTFPNLPSLNALRAFDALARTGSVTSAARALSVTQGAVSHQLTLLEEWFGTDLVRRRGRGLDLTETGKELARSTRDAFQELEDGCARVARNAGNELDLAAPASFLSHWLVPRLEDLEAALPGLRLRLSTDGTFEDLRSGRRDAVVACAVPPWPTGLRVTEIGIERIGPVCAKKWSTGARETSWPNSVPRLASASRPDAWREWARSSGIPAPRGKIRTFDHLVPLLEAARAGLGVAMVPELIVRRQLEEGTLLAPCGFVDGSHRYVLAHREDHPAAAALEELSAWFATQGDPALRLRGAGTSRRG